jgi:hypothetical protein
MRRAVAQTLLQTELLNSLLHARNSVDRYNVTRVMRGTNYFSWQFVQYALQSNTKQVHGVTFLCDFISLVCVTCC